MEKFSDEVYLMVRHFVTGSIRIICHVEVDEPDPVTKRPCKIFRQHVDVISIGSDDFKLKQKIVEGIIEGFQEILETMKRDRKYGNSD